jgi:energy-coupling factor transporter ATP-binding protein EcfA2
VIYYEVFGGVFQSEIEFPELAAIDARRPDWTLTRCSSLPTLRDRVLLGEEELAAGVTARFERGADRFRLSFDDTGTFDIMSDGSRIEWVQSPNGDSDLVRSDFLGRVLAVALHAAGDLCLHGSAAALNGNGIVLVGPKGYGKSTLAMALIGAGAGFVADDAARLTANPPRVAVGVPALRLRGDAAAHFGVESTLPTVGDKVVLRDLGDADEDRRWLPLDAVYVVAPRRAPGAPPASRRRLSELEATLALVQHGKSAALLGKDEAGTALARASALARSVPVFVLEVARDLALVAQVASQMMLWHSASPVVVGRSVLSLERHILTIKM